AEDTGAQSLLRAAQASWKIYLSDPCRIGCPRGNIGADHLADPVLCGTTIIRPSGRCYLEETMRPAVKITLAVGSLLIISACGAQDAPTVPAAQVASAPASASVTPSMVSSAPLQASPVVKKRIVTSRRAIPFKTMRVSDSTLSKGSNRVRSRGVRGVEILTYKITFRNGIQVRNKLIRTVIVRAPVTQVIAVGTKETQ